MCQHDSICSNAQTLPNDWSREMARLNFSEDQFFLQHTDIGRIIVYCGYVWVGWCLITGAIHFILRCKSHWEGGNTQNCTITGLCVTCCHDCDSALNPLSDTKYRLSTWLAETEMQFLDSEMRAKSTSKRQDNCEEIEKQQAKRIVQLEAEVTRIVQRLYT